MKITILLDYPDNANPKFGHGMTALGGTVESIYFGDLFAEVLGRAITRNHEGDERAVRNMLSKIEAKLGVSLSDE
ncbi:MAG: hypothetical protein KDE46_18335 [Caldilineaceae bacterium]|nr:hypothetical protein [Caldilineaceae bacterium]